MAWTFYNSSGEAMIIDGGLANVVEDTTPQLGGNLDMQARLLVGNGGSTGIAISANGEVTMAAQPAVAVRNSVKDSNVTGAGTAATVDFNIEEYDQNADFASDTFTAPVTGQYHISVQVQFLGLTSASTSMLLNVISSNRNFRVVVDNSAPAITEFYMPFSMDVNMDAADTVTVTLTIYGESSDVVDIDGSSEGRTTFSARLVA